MSRNGTAGVALLASIVLHVLLALWLARLMRPRVADTDAAMRVVLHDDVPSEPALPIPPPPTTSAATRERTPSASPRARLPAGATPERPAKNDAEERVAPPSLRLFNLDGSIRLPASDPGPFERALALGRELMKRGHNVLHCRRGRFDPKLTAESVAQRAAKQTAGFHRMFDDPNQMEVIRETIAAADVLASHDTAIVAHERLGRVCDEDRARGEEGAMENTESNAR